MTEIAILDDYQHAALASADWSPVSARAQITVFHDHLDDEHTLVARLAPFDALSIMRERTHLPRQVLERLPNLRFIASTGGANPAIDLEAARDHRIVVSFTGGAGNGAPELTWALILAAARQLPAEVGQLRGGAWQNGVGLDLEGQTLGIVGLGKIGRRVAAVANAFGMNVIAWNPRLTDEAAAAAGARRVDKDELLRTADWVSLHLALVPETRGVIGADEFALMKRTAWLVNTARGPLVDEAALIGALRARDIAGAALDVFDREPLPVDHPLRTLPNVVATPHIGFVTQDTYRTFYGQTVENLLAWMDGAPIRVS